MADNLDNETLHAVFCLALGLPVASTQQVVADRLGMSQTLYNRVLHGERTSLRRVAELLRGVGRRRLADAIDQVADSAESVIARTKAEVRAAARADVNGFLVRELEQLTL